MEQAQIMAMLWLIVAMIADMKGEKRFHILAFLMSILSCIFFLLEFLRRFAG